MDEAGYINSGNAFGRSCNFLYPRGLHTLTNKQTNKQTNNIVMKDSRLYTAFTIAATMLFTALTVITALPMIMHITTGAGDVRSCLILLIPSAVFAAVVKAFAAYLIKD